MKIRFIGRDPAKGIQIEGVTYHPGDVADLGDMWGRVLVASGEAVAYMPPLVGEQVNEVETVHRDTFARAKRDRK